MIDKGSQHEVQRRPAGDRRRGVVGQVTRVYPWLAEVTLITDKGQLVPVLNMRNGLRAVLAGTGNDGALELKFIPLNADFENGDQLVTSGIDGVYPPGLPVAQVVERRAQRGLSVRAHHLQAARRREQPQAGAGRARRADDARAAGRRGAGEAGEERRRRRDVTRRSSAELSP